MSRCEIEWLTPLYWADPPFTIVNRIYWEARRAVPRCNGFVSIDPALNVQPWLRKVAAEFERRLEVYGIYVEGM